MRLTRLLPALALAVTACASSTASPAPTSAASTIASSTTPATTAPTTTAPTATVPATTAAPTSTVPATTATPTTSAPAATCTPPPTAAVQAVDAGNDRDVDVTSFDSTVIRAHWFPVTSAAPAPTVLMGPGWGSAGDVDTSTPGLLGSISINSLRDHGYNVLTWDPRGFGQSTGTVEVDSPDAEGRDVEQLISWVATLPGVQLDGAGDPRLGMVGGSYGGGIQFVTAAQDCRVDAIVPIIAWHSLVTSLDKANTPKLGWGTVLANAGGPHLDPMITASQQQMTNVGSIAAEQVAWFAARGPGDDLVAKIRVPTLVIQGTVDTLFTLDEAVANYGVLRASGTTVSMLWFCGGHGTCLTDPGDTTRVGVRALAWLDRYVREDTSVDPGPPFEMVDQHGTSYVADTYPAPDGSPITAAGGGSLALVADGGSGPPTGGTKPAGIIDSVAFGFQPGRAANAIDITIPAPSAAAVIVGSPHLTMTYTGTSPAGDRPTRVFAQLVDDATGVVLGNQITPIEVTLDGQAHTIDVDLETVAHRFDPGSTITLQIVATTTAYAPGRLGGTVDVTAARISLPVVTGHLTAQG